MKNKLILDFDGIFASDMIYSQEGKSFKTFPWGIRHSIDLLTQHGFEVYIITGDSTEFGRNISAKFCHNLKIEEILFVKSHEKLNVLRDKFNLDECIYSGDDIYDIEIFKQTYSIISSDGHEIFNSVVDYKSKYTTRDYYFMDMAIHILQKFRYQDIETNTLTQYIVKESSQRSYTDMLKDQRYQNVFILQQYSMRNHTDGTYNPILDGNLNLTLHRVYDAIKAKPKMKVYLSLPDNVDEDQMNYLYELIDMHFDNRVKFVKIKYGLNAYENRKKFSDVTCIEKLVKNKDLIISDFEMSEFNTIAPVYYNFNISKVKELDRWFVDDFYSDQELRAFKAENQIYVLNQNQKDYMLSQCSTPFGRMIINANVIVDNKVINKQLFHDQVSYFNKLIGSDISEEISNTIQEYSKRCDGLFFMPFRLTDSCYNFKGILEVLNSDCNGKYIVLVTNPNDGDIIKDTGNVEIVNIAEKFKDINKKSLYYVILESLQKLKGNQDHSEIYIPICEDPEMVVHQSLIEMEILAPNVVNFIDNDNLNIETLLQNTNNKFIQTLIY
jgi:3-deoxy-D-manno-octulosonate 8-phosphate phosphatase KdsC-like HAD superfamily phosphatase